MFMLAESRQFDHFYQQQKQMQACCDYREGGYKAILRLKDAGAHAAVAIANRTSK